jgi:hypothetical protein
MTRMILVPYDGSPPARAAAARAIAIAKPGRDRIMLAVPSLTGGALVEALIAVRRMAGGEIQVEGTCAGVTSDDEAFHRCLLEMGPSMVVVPLVPDHGGHAFRSMVRAALRFPVCPTIAVDLTGSRVRAGGRGENAKEERSDGRHRVDTAYRTLLHAGARLRLGLGALVRGAAE